MPKCTSVKFVRYTDAWDLIKEAPSVVHFLEDEALSGLVRGGSMLAIPAAGQESEEVSWMIGIPGAVCQVSSVNQVHLLEVLTEDELERLGCDDAEAYLEFWDETYPGAVSTTNPMVVRVEFELTGRVGRLDLDPTSHAPRLIVRILEPMGEIQALEDADLFRVMERVCNPPLPLWERLMKTPEKP